MGLAYRGMEETERGFAAEKQDPQLILEFQVLEAEEGFSLMLQQPPKPARETFKLLRLKKSGLKERWRLERRKKLRDSVYSVAMSLLVSYAWFATTVSIFHVLHS